MSTFPSTLTLSARTNPDLRNLMQVRDWWASNQDCLNHSMCSGTYGRRTDVEDQGISSVSFRYNNKRQQAMLTCKNGYWHINDAKFCLVGLPV